METYLGGHSGSRGAHLGKVLAVSGQQGLVGRLQKLLGALQGSRAGSQLVLQVPCHQEKRHLTPRHQTLPGLLITLGIRGTMSFSNSRWEMEARGSLGLSAGRTSEPFGDPFLRMDMWRDFPGGTVTKTPSSQCRGPGLIPGQGPRFHML